MLRRTMAKLEAPMLPMLEDHREFDVSKAMYVPLGMASPLWLPFAAATGAGLTFWWMTRWTQAANLEAMMQAMAPPTTLPVVSESASQGPEPVLETVEAMTAQAEQVAETAAETMEAVAAEAQEAVETAADDVEPAVPPLAKKKAKPAPDAPLH